MSRNKPVVPADTAPFRLFKSDHSFTRVHRHKTSKLRGPALKRAGVPKSRSSVGTYSVGGIKIANKTFPGFDIPGQYPFKNDRAGDQHSDCESTSSLDEQELEQAMEELHTFHETFKQIIGEWERTKHIWIVLLLIMSISTFKIIVNYWMLHGQENPLV